MDISAEAVLSEPLDTSANIPLRVAVYSRIMNAIRGGHFPVSSILPSESDLGSAMKVSRTVVREALMLLEEDGYVRSRRGIGRFVATRLPRVGLERIRPMEEILAEAGTDVQVSRTTHVLHPSSSVFTAEPLGIREEDPSWFFESIIRRDGAPIALVQEHVASKSRLMDSAPEAAQAITEDIRKESTLLANLIAAVGPSFGPGETDIAAGTPGVARGELLDLDAKSPVLILTQTVEHSGRICYLAKTIVNTGTVQISIIQGA
ncbi:GntR family transcriptional regulator [Arthrobacter sp. CJ23]|uniref:GntR family transcriptional regulator n=1 Tax=Arthrobacter sp. CJ23 TaxID=2972479 RepID=UPI00215C837A|nr:GntR family transcriptional regulator [Arthrobacter sp. CJ23]UVJ39370.1 GntR family transcriptional regulator [Arthrobacter sp. CJ23]